MILKGRNPYLIENINTISFVGATEGGIYIYFKDRDPRFHNMTVVDFYKLLPHDRFCHAHEANIINMNFVLSFEKRGNGLMVKLIDLNQARVSPDNIGEFAAMIHLSSDITGDMALLKKYRKT